MNSLTTHIIFGTISHQASILTSNGITSLSFLKVAGDSSFVRFGQMIGGRMYTLKLAVAVWENHSLPPISMASNSLPLTVHKQGSRLLMSTSRGLDEGCLGMLKMTVLAL